MPLTPEEVFEKGQTGARKLFLKLAMLECTGRAIRPFEDQASQLGLPPRSVATEEEKRLYFDLACLGIAVMGMESRKYVMNDSVFSPKFDSAKHERFLEGMYDAATVQLDAHGISSLRTRLPRGNRNADSLKYQDGKPLSGSHLKDRSEEYTRRMLGKVERGDEDYTSASNEDFVFHVTELLDARLTNRNEPVKPEILSIAGEVTELATDVVNKELFQPAH